jgi:hypothetical protein
VFAAEPPAAAPAELSVVTVERGVPLAPDAIYAQDAFASLVLADLYPLTPQLFAAHGDREDVWLPPQLAGVVARVVVFDDRGAERARAAALPHELVRLRRPVDLDRIAAIGPLPDRPSRAQVSLDGLSDYRRGLLQRVLAETRIEVGGDPHLAIGHGPAVLDAMANGLPVYVYGDDGGDGWVTAERYEQLEADGFSGRAGVGATTFERLRADLEGYDPGMGPANRELVAPHDARRHAHGLANALGALERRREPVDAPLRELARLVRLEAASARRAEALAAEVSRAQARAAELERRAERDAVERDELATRVAELERALDEARREVDESQRARGVRALLGRESKSHSTEG